MVDTRKYLRQEIHYVLSRLLAGWRPDIIAKAFKQEHAPYWTDREFTKKQVSYIKTTYKGPPGAICPYPGPIPQNLLTPSPSPQVKSGLIENRSKMDRKRKNVDDAVQEGNKSKAVKSEHASSQIISSLQMGQAQGAHGANAAADMTAQTPAAAYADVPEVDFSAVDNQTLNNLNWAGLDPINQADVGNEFNTKFEDCMRNARFYPEGENPDALVGQPGPNTSDMSALINEIMAEQGFQTGLSSGTQAGHGTLTGCVSGAGESNTAPMANSEVPDFQLPPGNTAEQPMIRDTHGVWYHGVHHQCQIEGEHRHHYDGGIYFRSEAVLNQSFLPLSQFQGMGYVIGLSEGMKIGKQGGVGLTEPRTQAPQNIAQPQEWNTDLAPNQFYNPFTHDIFDHLHIPGPDPQQSMYGMGRGPDTLFSPANINTASTAFLPDNLPMTLANNKVLVQDPIFYPAGRTQTPSAFLPGFDGQNNQNHQSQQQQPQTQQQQQQAQEQQQQQAQQQSEPWI